MLKMTARYMYSILSPKEQAVYKKIVEGIRRFDNSIRLNGSVSFESIKQIVEYVVLDYPQLYYADFSRVSFSQSVFFTEIGINYWLSKSEVETFDREILKRVTEVFNSLHISSLDENAKLNMIYDYMVKNVQYDFTPNGNAKYAHCIIGPVLYNKGVCEGISKSFKLLCDAASISSIVVTGTAVDITNNKNVNHAWNIARIESTCAHVDVTWDICAFNSGNYFLDYFGLSDEEIGKDHFTELKLPKCVGFSKSKSKKRIGLATLNKSLLDFLGANKTQESFELNSDINEAIFKHELQKAINTSITSIQVDYSYNQHRNTVFVRKR